MSVKFDDWRELRVFRITVDFRGILRLDHGLAGLKDYKINVKIVEIVSVKSICGAANENRNSSSLTTCENLLDSFFLSTPNSPSDISRPDRHRSYDSQIL
jgi:hypothetical protein